MPSYLDLFDKMPFGTIPDPHFGLLWPEADELRQFHRQGARVLLEGPRRIGKTLLVKSVIPADYLLLIDLRGLKTEARVVAAIRTAIELYSGKSPGDTNHQSDISEGGTRSPLTYLRSRQNQTTTTTDLETLFAEISRLGKISAPLVVFFDEIQAILDIPNGLDIAERIRALSQHHDHIAYFFAGSNSHLLAQLTDSANTPFYKQLTRVTLRPLDRGDFSTWIRKRLKKEKLTIDDETLAFVFDFARDIPGDVQRVLGDAFTLAKSRTPPAKTIDTRLIDFAIQRSLSDQAVTLDTLLNSLRGNQRLFLLALAAQLHNDTKHPLTGAVMRRATRINSPGTIDSTREALAKKGFISLWQNQLLIDDPYLEAALVTRYSDDYRRISHTLLEAS